MIDKLAQAARGERNEVSHSPQLSGVALVRVEMAERAGRCTV